MGHDGRTLAISDEQRLRALKLYHGKSGHGSPSSSRSSRAPSRSSDSRRPWTEAEADRRRGRVDRRTDIPHRNTTRGSASRSTRRRS